MPKRKGAKGTKVTLKIAKDAIRMTPEGHRRLTLSNMGITIFPICLLKLSNLDELDLSRNLIKTLPDNIGDFTSLKRLDLHSNKLESVPESIGNLVLLTHLNLCNNRLTSTDLPSTLGSLTSLKSLNLGMNQLDALPPTLEALDNLQELGLFDNNFVNLPEFVKVNQNLIKVNVKRNPVSYLQKAPEEEVFLVHESTLCRTCLKRCKEDSGRGRRGGGEGGGGGGGGEGGGRAERGCSGTHEDKRLRFSGLMAPNSVALLSQDVWRMKDNVRRMYPYSCCHLINILNK